MTQATNQDPYLLSPEAVQDPPVTWMATLRQIGPGLILTASIVGTGELIATTNLGAKAGFSLMWLVLLSCFVKVFIQIELGRYSLSSGQTTLGSFRKVPRIGNGLCWLWFVMMILTQFQIGAMIGGVAQALNLALPSFAEWIGRGFEGLGASLQNLAQSFQESQPDFAEQVGSLGSLVSGWGGFRDNSPEIPWALIVTLVTIYILVRGRYHLIERYSTILVGLFTLTTVLCVVLLPGADTQSVYRKDVARKTTTMVGLLNSPSGQGAVLSTGVFAEEAASSSQTTDLFLAAFAMIGITGVGASELVAYPYWCLEKRYARYSGPREESESWLNRARGWMRVMQADAWLSMIVYTLATIAFYILGAAVLFPQTQGRGLSETTTGTMLTELALMYEPVLGHSGSLWFICIGGFVVLYSTLFAATAGNSRVTTDFLRVQELVPFQPEEYRIRWIRMFSRLLPLFGLVLFLFIGSPVSMVIIGGVAQAFMLPIIAAVSIYLRWKHTDQRLIKKGLWDVLLWISLIMFTLAAGWGIWNHISAVLGSVGE